MLKWKKEMNALGYACVLKDNSGKPSGYRECDGEVAYMPKQQSYENIFRKVKIDLETMEVLNHDFIKDKQHVYRRGILLCGITPEGFRVHNAVYVGNHQVIYTPYGDAKIEHPESFEVLDDGNGQYGPEGYGRDAKFVYFFTCSTDTRHAIRLKACKNPAAFTPLIPNTYAKDDTHVYLWQAILKKADPKTFTILEDGYSHDSKHVFWGHNEFKANLKSFVVLRDGYACDDKSVFWRGKAFEADVTTFEVLEDGYAKDGNHMFRNGTIIKEKTEQ